ncbi:MAG: DoxX family protein [Rhodospirillales bacterium]|nr:DoxX family protein [Rhodospirillales bacterium]
MDSHSRPASQLFIPALGGLYARLACFAYPLVRIVAGLWLVPHGAQKLFGDTNMFAGAFDQMGLEPALPLVYLVGLVEFVGGLMMAVGLLTLPAAAAAATVLFVAVVKVHLPMGFMGDSGGFEYPLMWALLLVAIVIRGGGALSIDRRIWREF